MKKKPIAIPKFRSESEEADWWASPEGREFVKRKAGALITPEGSRLVSQLNRPPSVQIALRLPEADVTRAREVAERKGIGYQTLLKMLIHEGLRRETGHGRASDSGFRGHK